jgi:hypothetical protein
MTYPVVQSTDEGLFSHLCEDTMYSLRIQVVVQVVAHDEQAFGKGLCGTWWIEK